MHDRSILLVEDNPDDEALTRRALAKNNIQNEILLARDGAEALDLLLGTGAHAGRPATPELVLLDLKLPKVDGLEVLRRVRANPGTRLLPVVILTSSREEKDVVSVYGLGRTATSPSPSTSASSSRPFASSGRSGSSWTSRPHRRTRRD